LCVLTKLPNPKLVSHSPGISKRGGMDIFMNIRYFSNITRKLVSFGVLYKAFLKKKKKKRSYV